MFKAPRMRRAWSRQNTSKEEKLQHEKAQAHAHKFNTQEGLWPWGWVSDLPHSGFIWFRHVNGCSSYVRLDSWPSKTDGTFYEIYWNAKVLLQTKKILQYLWGQAKTKNYDQNPYEALLLNSTLNPLSLAIQLLTACWRAPDCRPWSIRDHNRPQSTAAVHRAHGERMLWDFLPEKQVLVRLGNTALLSNIHFCK